MAIAHGRILATDPYSIYFLRSLDKYIEKNELQINLLGLLGNCVVKHQLVRNISMKSLVAMCALFIVGLLVPSQSAAAIGSFGAHSFLNDPGECLWMCGAIYESTITVNGNLRDHYLGLCGSDVLCQNLVDLEYDLLDYGAAMQAETCANACLEEAPF